MQILKQNNIEDIYPLTPLQEGIYFHYLYEESPVYFCQTSYSLRGEIDVDKFHKSFIGLLERYGQLRSVFLNRSGKLLQVILKSASSTFDFVDARIEQDTDDFVTQLRNRDVKKGFELEKDLPLRLTLVCTGSNTYECIWSHHHIIMDGWCISILVSEFFKIYRALINLETPKLGPAIPFSVYHDFIKSKNTEAAAVYWKKYLEGFDERSFITNSAHNSTGKFSASEFTTSVSKDKTQLLLAIARKNNTTPSILVQVIWGVLLSKYTNRQDLVFGAVVSGRPPEIEDVESIVGLFINTVPIRLQFDKNTRITELLREAHSNHIESEEFHHHPLVEIQTKSEINEPLFDHLLVFENYPVAATLNEGDDTHFDLKLEIEDVKVVEQTNYNLNLLVHNREDKLEFCFKFNELVIRSSRIEKIAAYLLRIIHFIIADDDIRVSDINILTPNELATLSAWNATDVKHEGLKKPIAEIFSEQCLLHPYRIALTFENHAISYAQLNIISDHLAVQILALTSEKKILIPIIVSRSIEMMVTILGILKAGCAYVPIDPNLPDKRKTFIIDDIKASFIITTSLAYLPDDSNSPYMVIDEEIMGATHNLSFKSISEVDDLAYVIYTSGSTGEPKGVKVSNRALTNRIDWMQRHYKLDKGDVIVQKTPLTFDVSVWEIAWWFFNGGQLSILKPEGERDPKAIVELISQQKVNFIHFVPSMFSAFIQFGTKPNDLKSLKRIFCSGEALLPDQLTRFYELMGKDIIGVSNLYGPTEACIDVSYYDCPRTQLSEIPIGRPIQNIELHVLDAFGALVPPETNGELYISGVGLAEGYFNRENLTAEAFFYHKTLKKRLYRTGDLARWNNRGQLIYLGRKDLQIKVRGVRIELSEIDVTVLKYPNVVAAVTVVQNDRQGDNYLSLYLQAKSQIKIEALKKFLEEFLPPTMIPQYYKQLESLPISSHGKVNRKALPKITVGSAEKARYPQDEISIELANLWITLLPSGTREIALDDHFFKVGGHSLKAVQLLSLIQKQFDIALSIQKVLQNPTLEAMAKEIEAVRWVSQKTTKRNNVTKVKL